MSDGFDLRSRIVGYERVRLSELIPHPENPRTHPERQRKLLRGVLERAGYVVPVIVSQNTNRILDGHLRCEVLKELGRRSVDVCWVDVTEAEELLVLATFDAVGSLAATDLAAAQPLLAGLGSIGNADVQAWLAEMYPAPRVAPVALGALENAETDPDLAEKAMTTYLHGDQRQIVLLMAGGEYDDMNHALGTISGREGLSGNTAALFWLLDKYEAEYGRA